MAYVVGLTGGIGSGKSTVAALFAALGAGIVDTDKVAHKLTGINGAAMPALAAEFGAECIAPDGSLRRDAMRQQVFSDANAKRRLETILHPLIGQEVERQLKISSASYVLLAVPLLVETGAYQDILSRTLVVDCRREAQVARTMARNGLSTEDVKAIMAHQASREMRCGVADDLVLNDDGLQALVPAVAVLDQRYRTLALRH